MPQPPGASPSRRAGNAILEFGLVLTPLVTLLMGVTVVGLALSRSIHVSRVVRDAGSMYVRGVDFSKDGNKNVLVRLAAPLGLARTGGTGVVILSKVTWIPQTTCIALSLSPCNGDQHVITQRITVGDPTLRASALGTPSPASLDSSGLVINYMQEPTAVATFPFLQLREGEYAYVSEAYFPAPDLDFPGFQTGVGNYSRAIF